MAKSPASDGIMSPDKMKPLLALSKREPVQAAIGLTADGDGIILLDKKARPKKVFSMLKASAGKAKVQLNTASLRFGRAEVDPEYDSGMVRFFINKDAPGNLRIKLVELVKRIPYQKVELNVDPSLEAEPEEDGETPDTAGPPGAAMEADAIPDAPPPPPAMPSPEAVAMGKDLSALAGRIAAAAGTDAARRASLVRLASEANTKLKAGDLAAAAQGIAGLRAALDTPAPDAPEPGGPASGIDAAGTRRELADLAGRIAAAAGEDNGRKAELSKLAMSANTALKANDLAAAADLVRQLREKLDPAPGEAPVSDLPGRLEVCRDDLRRLRDPAAREAVTKSIQEIEALMRDGKASAAASLIDVLETRIAAALRETTQSNVAADAGHMVDFAKLLLRWRDAQKRFDDNLRDVGKAILANPEISSSPHVEVFRQAVSAFPTLVPRFGGALEEALNDGISAAEPSEKARRAAEAISAVDAYRQQIAGLANLAKLEQFASRDLGTRLPLRDALDEALVELKQMLATRG